MESKTKHRILGLLVLAGLIVILLPFFQRGKDISSETALITPPPFPDQSIQVSNEPTEPAHDVASAPTSMPEPAKPAAPQSSLPIVQKTADEIIKEQPDDVIDTTRATSETVAPLIDQPSINTNTEKTSATPTTPETTKVETQEEATPEAPTPTTLGKTAITSTEEITPKAVTKTETIKTTLAADKKAKKTVIATAKRKLAKRHTYLHLPIDNNGLANINSSAWVIQVGSYKNKANALRVVNRLRANGYRAFIQQVSTTRGKQTRVFVGPESKQSQAHSLAQELETDMKVQGIVISYKPLAS